LILKTTIAIIKFENNHEIKVDEILEKGSFYITKCKESFQSIDLELYRQHYCLSMNYFRNRQNSNSKKYLNSVFKYFSYQSVDSFDIEIQRGIARDVIYAAIFSEDTFNFGEIISHPIMNSIKKTPHEDLFNLLKAFDNGNIEMFNKYKNCLLNFQKQLSEVQNMFINEKIQIMSIIILCWRRAPVKKNIHFSTISLCCKIDENKVEYLLMKILSKGLIQGKINEVKKIITIKNVIPRNIDLKGIKLFIDRINFWLNRINKIIKCLEK